MAMATEKYNFSLCEDLLEIAKIKVNENPEELENIIEKLRIWIKKENLVRGETCTAKHHDTLILKPELGSFLLKLNATKIQSSTRSSALNEWADYAVTLMKILRYNKFDLAKSQARFQLHYRSRLAIPEWYLNRDPLDPVTLQVLKLGLCVPLNYDSKGRRIMLNRLGHYDTSLYTVHDVYKASTIVSDFMTSDVRTQINGFVNLCDFSQFGRTHAMSYTPCISKIVSLMQDCVPVKMEEVYCWNTPAVFTAVYNLAKFFLSNDTKKRFHFLPKNEEDLHAVLPRESLPTEYGGTAGPLQDFIDSTVKEVSNYRERLLFDDDYISGKKK